MVYVPEKGFEIHVSGNGFHLTIYIKTSLLLVLFIVCKQNLFYAERASFGLGLKSMFNLNNIEVFTDQSFHPSTGIRFSKLCASKDFQNCGL